MIVVAGHGGPGEQGDVGHVCQFCADRFGPLLASHTVQGDTFGQQRSAWDGLLVGKDHPRARASGGACRLETGRAGADDEHVAVGKTLLVGIRVGFFGRLAKAGGAPDEAFIERPCLRRPHKRLVVESLPV